VLAARAFADARAGEDRWSHDAAAILGKALADGVLTGRGYDKVRRVARTVADLFWSEEVVSDHVHEAMALRAS
jgi:predicted ATPase with chaperone activity